MLEGTTPVDDIDTVNETGVIMMLKMKLLMILTLKRKLLITYSH